MGAGRILRPTSGANSPRPITQRTETNVPYRYIRPMARSSPRHITHRLYGPSGNEKWRADHGHTVYGVAVDSQGHFYTCGGNINFIPIPRPDDWVAQYRLAKWSATGKLLWRIDNDTGMSAGGFGPPTYTFTVRGYDVAVDSDDNVWLATGIALEKYSPDGDLLLTRVDSPDIGAGAFTGHNYVNGIRRVGVTSDDLVVFGGQTARYNQYIDHVSAPILASNTCETDGTDYGVVYPAFSASWRDSTFSLNVRNDALPYCFDSDGYFYQSALSVLPGRPNSFYDGESGYTITLQAHNRTLAGVGPAADTHQIVGAQQAYSAANDWPNYPGSAAISVYAPTQNVLMAWGLNGYGQIKEIGTIIPSSGLPYINDRPNLITETNAGIQGVLSVNNNFRYLYGLTNDTFSGTGFVSHRVREYPDTLLWEGHHGGVVRDGIMLNDNRAIIAGDRVSA